VKVRSLVWPLADVASATHSRTPIVMSTDEPSDLARDYVQIGAIEINRMGALRYHLCFNLTIDHTLHNAGGNLDL